MKTLLLAGAAMALALPHVAAAQDHSGHQTEASAPSPLPSPAPTPAPAPSEEMDHATMDHSHGLLPAIEASEDAHAGHTIPEGPVEASGTSRLPQAEGMMPGIHFDIGGGWSGMAHGYAWGVYTDQTGPRGDDMVFVQSMAMLMAERDFEGGRLQLKGMVSADPLMGDRGYPILFAAGETADGMPLVDRQHPHDLFMELAARVDVDIAEGTTAFLYGGPVGEPALGPPAYMHRASARLNPARTRPNTAKTPETIAPSLSCAVTSRSSDGIVVMPYTASDGSIAATLSRNVCIGTTDVDRIITCSCSVEEPSGS